MKELTNEKKKTEKWINAKRQKWENDKMRNGKIKKNKQ